MSTLAHYRPRSPLEILDASFHIYRGQFAELLLISAIVTVPFAIAGLFLPPALATLIDRIGGLLLPVAEAATAVAVFSTLAGTPVPALEAFRRVRVGVGTLIGVQILRALAFILGLLLLIVPGVLAYIWMAVAIPAAAIEGGTIDTAASRSRFLARGHKAHVLRTMLLAWGGLFVVLIAFGFGLGAVSAMFTVSERVSDLLLSLALTLVLPLPSIAGALLYVDLRVRREALDVEAFLGAIAAAPGPPVEMSPSSPT